MARTVRNPLENRTPVRTISSVMRNAPRQNFRPTQLDFGDVPDYGYGRPNQGYGGQPRTPVNQAVTSVVRPTTGTTKPVAPVVAKPKPIAKPQTIAKPKTTSVVKPAVKPTTPVKPAVAVKPTTPVKPAVAPVKPITQPVAKTPIAPVKPITSVTPKTTTSPVKPVTGTPKTTTTPPKTSTGSNLTSTLLKTAAGAGAGTLLSKLLTGGTKTTTSGGTTGGTTGGTAGRTTTTGGGGTSRPIGIPVGGGSTKTAAKSTPAAGAAAKTAQKTATKAAEIKAADPTLTDEEIQAELDRIKAEEQSLGVPEDAVLGEDGNYTVADADGNISTYDKDGNLIGYEGPEATALTQGEGEGDDTTGGLNAKTDTTDTVAGEDTTGMTDLGEGYFQDGSGNIYSASGDLLYAVDESGAYHDPSGDLIYDPNADSDVADVADETVDETDTSVADNTWTDPDSGETWNMGDDGLWTLEGDTTDYTDDTLFADETDSADETLVAEDDYIDDSDYEVKKGGAIHRKTKGGLQRFADGDSVYSDTTEEVQPWQNVDYNYGELDDPTLTGYTATGEINPVGNIYARTASLPEITSGDSMDGNLVDWSDNGDGTASYWDGDQYVTVDSETGNELYRTDDSGNIIDSGEQATGPVTSAGSGNRESYATAAAQQANRGNQQDQSGVIDALMGYVQNNPGLAGGAIGALLASMLDQAGSGETAMPSQPVDISALTAFGPRTTDFGPGMTGGRTGTGSPIVSYADYAEGYGAEEPDDRLYSDLGISGWLREPDMADYRDEEGNLTDRFGNPVDELGYLLDDGSGEYVDESAVPEEEMAVEDAVEAEEEPAMAAGGPTTHYTFGRVIDPAENLGIGQGMKKGGLSQAHTVHSHHTNPVINNRVDFRQGSAVNGAGDGQSDDIPAWLADGEYVMDAELVSMLGNGSNKAGAKVLDKFRESIRAHKRSAPLGKIPPKAKSPLNYLKESMNG